MPTRDCCIFLLRRPPGRSSRTGQREEEHPLAKLRKKLARRRPRDAAAKAGERRALALKAAQKGGRQAYRYAKKKKLNDVGDLPAADELETSRPVVGQQATQRALDSWHHIWTRKRGRDGPPSEWAAGDEELPPVTLAQLKDVCGKRADSAGLGRGRAQPESASAAGRRGVRAASRRRCDV